MRILLDSSVLIAALARPGVCTDLVDEISRNHQLVLSDYILGEVDRKLREKFGLSQLEATALVSGIRQLAELVEPVTLPAAACRDVEDLPILGSAVAGGAGLLVTVDKDLLSLGEFRGIPIVKPGEFWKRNLGSSRER